MLEGIVPKATLNSDTNCKFRGVLKTTFRFNNFLEGVIELPDSDLLVVTVYYRERIQIKVCQKKRCIGQSLGGFQT